MSAVEKMQNAEAAVLELSMFFIRHSLPQWPAAMAPVLQALRACEGPLALDAWGKIALMGEYGLMQVQVTHINGYRAPDLAAEQRHFERLLQQALDAINNLRLFLRTGTNRPLITIYPDSPLP